MHVRRFPVNHLQRHNPQRPDVDFVAILDGLVHHLWRHPVRRADHGPTGAFPGAKLGAEAEVGQFHFAAFAQQHVVRLDISVDEERQAEIESELSPRWYSTGKHMVGSFVSGVLGVWHSHTQIASTVQQFLSLTSPSDIKKNRIVSSPSALNHLKPTF